MADATAKPFSFDEKAFNDKLTKQVDFLMKYSGVKGYNPYIEIEKIKNLKARYDGDTSKIPAVAGERSEALYKAAMSMVEELSPITSTKPEPDPNPPVGKQLTGPSIGAAAAKQ